MFQMKFNVALDSKNLTETSGKSFVDRKNMEVLFLDNAQHCKVDIYFFYNNFQSDIKTKGH